MKTVDSVLITTQIYFSKSLNESLQSDSLYYLHFLTFFNYQPLLVTTSNYRQLLVNTSNHRQLLRNY